MHLFILSYKPTMHFCIKRELTITKRASKHSLFRKDQKIELKIALTIIKQKICRIQKKIVYLQDLNQTVKDKHDIQRFHR